MFKFPRISAPLFVSIAVHLIGFIILGMIFLKAKPYEEYIEATFVEPIPEKRKMQVKKNRIQMIRPAHISNTTKQLPRITTAVKISGTDNIGFDLGAPVMEDAPLLVGTGVYESHPTTVIAMPQSVRPRVNSSFFKKPMPTVANISALPTLTLENDVKLLQMSDINIRDKNANALRQYSAEIKRKIDKEKKYPKQAERNGHEGQVEIKFKILADGQVENVEIVNPSGYDTLDNEAIRAVLLAAPYPPIPESIKRGYIIVKVPIVFKLR